MNKFRSMTSTDTVSALLLAGALLMVCGCHKQPTIKLDSNETKAFDNAPADAKQAWQSALAADAANDYLNAQKLLDGLKQMPLSDEQKQAVTAEIDAFHYRLWQAAEKNDPAAVQAAVQINKTDGTGR